jgi:hypothetical protein
VRVDVLRQLKLLKGAASERNILIPEKGRNEKRMRNRKEIQHWESVKVLHSDQSPTGKTSLGIVIDVQRPVYEDGTKGRPALNCILSRGNRSLRFPMSHGLEEVRAFMVLTMGLEEKLEEVQRLYNVVCEGIERAERKAFSGQPQQEYGRPGQGLSRFSSISKADRKKMKRKGGDNICKK